MISRELLIVVMGSDRFLWCFISNDETGRADADRRTRTLGAAPTPGRWRGASSQRDGAYPRLLQAFVPGSAGGCKVLGKALALRSIGQARRPLTGTQGKRRRA